MHTQYVAVEMMVSTNALLYSCLRFAHPPIVTLGREVREHHYWNPSFSSLNIYIVYMREDGATEKGDGVVALHVD